MFLSLIKSYEKNFYYSFSHELSYDVTVSMFIQQYPNLPYLLTPTPPVKNVNKSQTGS
jgi:hypothetical protein